ncbi:MAG: substrate-binding domain-containing protein [Planctomycetes bacterium]|nr:substrate-binding domain-containing protein [Planctomycetota bacterium]
MKNVVMRSLAILILSAVLAAVGCGKQDSSGQAGSGGDGATTEPAADDRTCVRGGAKATGLLKIAVIPKGTTHEFWKSIHAGALKAEVELKDVDVDWKGPVKEDDRNDQISVVENFINAGVAGIAIAPLDNVALVRPVREATKAGIGVVIMDSGLSADVCTDYASYVATDNYVGGCKGAERLGEVLGGKGKVIMMRYQEGSASTMQREQGFLDTIKKKFPNIELISSDQRGGATTESALATGENLLNRFKEVDGIFCPNESTTFGMLLAIQQSGLEGEVKFVGFDSSEKLIRAMADRQIHGLVLQDPMNMGYLAVKTLVAYLRGEAVPSRIDTGSVVATPENMNEPRIKELLSPPIDKYLP